MYSPAAVLDEDCCFCLELLVCDVFLVGVDTPAGDDDALDDAIFDKYISIVLFRGSAAGFLSLISYAYPIQLQKTDNNHALRIKCPS